MKEIWKDIEGYEGLYQVSNLGRVKSLGNGKVRNPNLKNERILKAAKDMGGYLRIALSKDGKKKFYMVHRLVASAFIPNPYSLPQVNHRDEDKTNNIIQNLEWCSAKYNSNYGTRTQRISDFLSKSVICVETGKIYNSLMQIEREMGFSCSNLSNVCNGKRKTCGGFHWRYTE